MNADKHGRFICPHLPAYDAFIIDTGVNADSYDGVIPKLREGMGKLLSCLMRKRPAHDTAPAILYMVSVDFGVADWPSACYGNPITRVVEPPPPAIQYGSYRWYEVRLRRYTVSVRAMGGVMLIFPPPLPASRSA